MSHGQCACPQCGTILRIRDRSFVGRQFPCPECRVDLTIALGEDQSFIANIAAPTPIADPTPVATPSAAIVKSRIQIGAILHSPLVLAWALGIGVTTLIAVNLLRPAYYHRKNPSQTETVKVPEKVDPEQAVKPEDSATQTIVKAPREPENPVTVDQNPAPATQEPAKQEPQPIPAMPDIPVANKPAPEVEPTPNPPPPPNAPPAPEPQPVKPTLLPKKKSVAERLKQPILKFQTSSPLPRRQILQELEEQSACEIRLDENTLDEKKLNEPISVSRKSTTVGEILKEVLDAAGWEYVEEDDGMRIRPRQLAGKKSE